MKTTLYLLTTLAGWLAAAALAAQPDDTRTRDSLRTAFETAFDSGALRAALPAARTLQRWHLRRPTIDSLAVLHAFKDEGMVWGTLNRYDSMYLLNERALAYAPNTPQGRRLRGGLKIAQIGLANSLRIPVRLNRELADIEQLYADIPEATQIERERLYATIGFKYTAMGYYDKAEAYLLKGKGLHDTNRATYEATGYGALRMDVQYAQLLHKLYTEADREPAMLRQLAVLDSLAEVWTFSSYERVLYGRSLIAAAGYYLQTATPPRPGAAMALLDRARAAFDPGLHQNYLRNVKHYTGMAARLRGDSMTARVTNLEILRTLTPQDRQFEPDYYLERLYNVDTTALAAAVDTLILVIHRGDAPPAADYHDFAPSALINDTRHLTAAARLLEASTAHREKAARVYRLALAQFEANYESVEFSRRLAALYQPAVAGLLRLHALGITSPKFGLPEILESIERVDSRLAWSEFKSAGLTKTFGVPDSLLLQEQTLRAALVRAKVGGAADSIVFGIEEALVKLENRVAYDYPAHAAFVRPKFSLAALQRQLAANRRIVRFKMLEGHLYRFVISAAAVGMQRLPGDDWEARIQHYLSGIHEDATDRRQDELTALLAGVGGAMVDQLTIIPDGPLHWLPFEALATPDGRSVLHRYTIHYNPFLIFAANPSADRPVRTAYAFAPDYSSLPTYPEIAQRGGQTRLAGAAGESAYVTTLFGGRLFSDVAFGKSAFVRHAPAADLLHLAMHADINPEHPELSYFDFGSASERLYVEELYGMRLRAELAVLSACNTANGKLDEGRGLVSLHRAFTYAGVPATVASLWAVPDAATEKIMRHFYERLAAGDDKAVALQRAKQYYLKSTDEVRFSAPFYWAGFVLYGDPAPVRDGGPSWWVYGLGLAGTLIGGTLLARRMG